MSDAATTHLQALDRPLPADLTGTGHGWFTRYRRYPVFSVPWARLRTLSFGVAAVLVVAVVVGPSVWDEPLDRIPLGRSDLLVASLRAGFVVLQDLSGSALITDF